jgi:ABC-type sulfate transport system permease subunit
MQYTENNLLYGLLQSVDRAVCEYTQVSIVCYSDNLTQEFNVFY